MIRLQTEATNLSSLFWSLFSSVTFVYIENAQQGTGTVSRLGLKYENVQNYAKKLLSVFDLHVSLFRYWKHHRKMVEVKWRLIIAKSVTYHAFKGCYQEMRSYSWFIKIHSNLVVDILAVQRLRLAGKGRDTCWHSQMTSMMCHWFVPPCWDITKMVFCLRVVVLSIRAPYPPAHTFQLPKSFKYRNFKHCVCMCAGVYVCMCVSMSVMS